MPLAIDGSEVLFFGDSSFCEAQQHYWEDEGKERNPSTGSAKVINADCH